ncbi:hypothetical protein FRC08_015718 [Ceratobasidium sp. 394]|nr:hypothetical protein FRC08_015718 [Ceratobasidium sp. 394]KAG9094404.1 hypothetical protein FS749_012532 [Ceratobasidium sp. UAMH 11750]
MPAERTVKCHSSRPSPLPKGRYAIPSSLPPPFGIDTLFDWSTSHQSNYSGSVRSNRTDRGALHRCPQRGKTSPSVRSWVEKQHSPSTGKRALSEVASTISISTGTGSQRPLFVPDSPTLTDAETLSSNAASTHLPTPAPSPVRTGKPPKPNPSQPKPQSHPP